MSKHTKGPWEFVDLSLVGPKIDDKPIWLRPVILRSEVGVNDADARLIVAAPDLLEACKSVIRAFELFASEHSINDEDLCITACKYAVHKATGGNK